MVNKKFNPLPSPRSRPMGREITFILMIISLGDYMQVKEITQI